MGQAAPDTQPVITTATDWWVQMTSPFIPTLPNGGAWGQPMELVDRGFDSVAQLMDTQRQFSKALPGMGSGPEQADPTTKALAS